MNLLKDLRDIFIPYRCIHCKNIINKHQVFLCSFCLLELEQTDYLNFRNNPLEKLFWGQVTIVRATSIYFYNKNNPIQSLLKKLKYDGLQEFGLFAAQSLIKETTFKQQFSDIDIVTLLPLHPIKEKKRGYNQVEIFAKTISKSLNKPFYKNILLKKENTTSQTTKNKELRYKNVQNSFQINTDYNLNNKHILLTDDVLTTGATLISCCKTLKVSPNIKISIITIACVV